MPTPSPWPLNAHSLRCLVPPFACQELARHPLSHELYPQALGYYRQASGHEMFREGPEHEDHLLLYCVQGHGEVGWAGHSERIGPGQLVVLPAGVGHRYAALPEQPWSLYWVHFTGSASTAFLTALLDGEAATVRPLGLSLVPEFQTLLEVHRQGYRLPVLLHTANQLRALLTRAALLAPRSPSSRGRFDVEAVQSYMQNHLGEALTLAQLAEAFGFDRFHFAKTYKRLTGRAPLTHFLHLKMEQAARLLDGGEARVSEVARLLGYDDAHYFSRQFRQIMGVAPSAYRGLKRG